MIRNAWVLGFKAVACALVAMAAPAIAQNGLVGDWEVIANVAGDEYPADMTIVENDGDLVITMSDDLTGEMTVDEIEVDGDKVTFSVVIDAISPDPLPIELTFDGATFEGLLAGGDLGDIPLTGKKLMAAIAAETLVGEWDVIADVAGDEYPVDMNISIEEGNLVVNMEDDLNGQMPTDEVKLDGSVLSLLITVGAISPDPLGVEVTFEGDTFEGILDGGDLGEIPLSGAKVAPAITAEDLVGDWEVIADVAGDEYPVDMNIAMEDGALAVTMEDDLNGVMPTDEIKLDGAVLSLLITVDAISPDPLGVEVTFEGDSFEGILDGGDLGEIPLSGTKMGASTDFASLAGLWEVIADVAGDEYPSDMTVSIEGGALKVVMEDDLNGVMPVDQVELMGSVLSFLITVDAISPDPLEVSVTIDGDTFEGVLDGGDLGEIPLKGTKAE
jgi:hypothetical protein